MLTNSLKRCLKLWKKSKTDDLTKSVQDEVNESYRKQVIAADIKNIRAFATFLSEFIAYPECKDIFAITIIDTAREDIVEIAADLLREVEGL